MLLFHCLSSLSTGIHEIIAFYWKLYPWYCNNEVLPNIDIHENLVGPDATINSSNVEQFCTVVPRRIIQDCEEQQHPGTNGFGYHYLEGNTYSFLACLILKKKKKKILGHHENYLSSCHWRWSLFVKQFPNSWRHKAHASATQTSAILSLCVTNSSEGKIVKVKGHCYRNN